MDIYMRYINSDKGPYILLQPEQGTYMPSLKFPTDGVNQQKVEGI